MMVVIGRAAACFAGLAVLLHPLFFIIYRLSVFATVPRDDYAPFLLWLIGKPGGFVPDSPYAYRIGAMLLAVPFYALPAIPLTNTPAALAPEYLKATAALSMLAFLAWVGTIQLTYLVARQARGDRLEAVLGAVLAGVLTMEVQFAAIDTVALLLIAACVASLRRPALLVPLLAVSVGVNEKVALVMAIWLGGRCLLVPADRAALLKPACFSVVAVGAYVAVVASLRLPGNSYQQDVSGYPATVLSNLAAYGTVRGMLLNLLPLAILAALALAGRHRLPFRAADALLVPALAVVALVLTQFFQAGRIAMHAAPIIAVPAGAGLAAWLRRSAAVTHPPPVRDRRNPH